MLLILAVTAYIVQYNALQKKADNGVEVAFQEVSPSKEPYGKEQVTYPYWKGYVDDTLAMNHMYSFFGYHGQGSLRLAPSKKVTGFRLYVNEILVDTAELTGGKTYDLDISSLTRDGENTVQISEITPNVKDGSVTLCVPYPEILPGTAEEGGFSAQALEMISDLIETDIRHGFTSAQLALIRNGRLVYENAWGKTNSYLPDGSPDTESPEVTTETLYDLASLTKMFSVNYALQKLVTDGEISLDAKITDFLGKEFVKETLRVPNEKGQYPEADLKQIKKWKKELTIRDLLRHQGGFPPDPKYCAPFLYDDDIPEGESYPENPLFAGNKPGKATTKATVDMICRTPLWYEPGTKTVYSDLDYMILGLVVEKTTGEKLDAWLKKTFWDPMGLTHITYNPLRNGFTKNDCAATELNGNTRDGLLDYPGYRTYTLQGEVHDEKAFYSMDGVSGHAGLFANASDVAKLASVMLSGGYGGNRYFSQNVIDLFTAPKMENAANWGLGWWRQGDGQRIWYFGSQAGSNTIGHQGWTGTLVMIDMQRGFLDSASPLCIPSAEATVPACAALIDRCHAAGIPVIYAVRHYRSDGSDVEKPRAAAWAAGGKPLSEDCAAHQAGEPAGSGIMITKVTRMERRGRCMALACDLEMPECGEVRSGLEVLACRSRTSPFGWVFESIGLKLDD